jgi:TRAP-type C4-dicarboxylate transport system substrate-binding protein
MKKAFAGSILLILLAVVGLAPAALAQPPAYTWKFATLCPANVGWAVHIENLVMPAINEATDGNFQAKIYWGGILGADEDYVRHMKEGRIQGAGLSALGMGLICPEMNILTLPFLFRDYAEVDYIRQTMTEDFEKLLTANGFFLVAWVDQDFDQIYSTKFPMTELDHFKQTKFIGWSGPVEASVIKELGASSVPVSVTDAAATLRSGGVDAAISPAIWMVGSQLYSTIRYINAAKIRYSPGLIVVTNETWQTLNESYREKFHSMRDEVMSKYCLAIRRDNERCMQSMIEYGVQMSQMTPDQRKLLENQTRPLWNKLAGDLYPQTMLDKLTGHLKVFREDGQ